MYCTLIYTNLIGCYPGIMELSDESYCFASKTERDTQIQNYTVNTEVF